MKPFDLARAKAGDLIYDTDTGVEFYFVGTKYNGEIVIEVYGAETIACRNQNELRMLPKKRTVWVNFYPNQELADVYPTESLADRIAGETRIGNKAYPVEIEE